jgi:hypothetical protein
MLLVVWLTCASLPLAVIFQGHTQIFNSSFAVDASATPFWQPSIMGKNIVVESIFPRPTNENTIIAMISMFNSTKTLVVERCIRSIRKSGNFTGYILLLTDRSEHYNYTLSWDPKTLPMAARDEDLLPKGLTIVHRPMMIPKRFKTFLMNYLEMDPRLATTTQYILYMDIDNVIASPLQPFFDDYYSLLMRQYSYGNLTDTSFFFAYQDSGEQTTGFWHSGLAMHHRTYSVGCLHAWRYEMDTLRHGWDQPLLMRVLENMDRYKCVVYELPTNGHFSLASRESITPREKMTTIVHITNSVRAKRLSKDRQAIFIRSALQLQDNETMVGNVMWDEVLPVPHFR